MTKTGKLYVGDGYWVTKEGTRIALVDMDDSHLYNSLTMIDRMMPQAKATLKRLTDSQIALSVEIKRRKDAAYKLRITKPLIKSKPAAHFEVEGRKFRD